MNRSQKGLIVAVLCLLLVVSVLSQTTQIGTLGAKSAEGAEKCKNSQRCKEIDEVWQKITQWVAKVRKGQIWDTQRGDWGSYSEKYLKTAQLEPGKPTPSITPGAIKQNLKAVAEREWLRWGQGTKKESDPDMGPVVASYNAAGDCAGNNPTVDPWSAAFISYAAKEAGVSDFPVSCLHTAYFRSIKNNPGICRTYPMSERSRIGIGDIVCACRVSAEERAQGKTECSVDYDNPSGFGHCDIVINTLGRGQVEVIGGNVQNNVDKKVLDITQDASSDRRWFGFISCGEEAAAQPSDNLCVATTGTPEQRALLDTIGWSEGTFNRYDRVVDGELVSDPNFQHRKEGKINVFTSYSSHPRILIKFKSGECTGDPLTSACSTAAGRYQFLYRLYEQLKARGLFGTGFNPKEQDKAALQLIADLGITPETLKKAWSENAFVPVWDRTAQVWASFPSSAHGGKSVFGQGSRSASSLQEKYAFCLQYHQSRTGAASPVPAQLGGGIKEKPDLSGECTIPSENKGKIESSGQGGCADGMVKVADFCIDRFEGALVDKSTNEPFSPYCSPSADGKATSGAILNLKAVSLAGVVPQGYISGDQASVACQNAGKHLCTQSEWLTACQGNIENKFPYGNTELAGQCNYGRAHPDVKTADTPNAKWEMTDPQVNKNYALAVTGNFGQCSTPQGVFDMTGNLQEWVDDGDPAPLNRFGGGYYGATLQQVIQEPAVGIGCGFQRVSHLTNHADYSTGFRCCANPIS